MRIYHPKTLETLSGRKDIPKRYSSSVWGEVFKWFASGQDHPKMFIKDKVFLGRYLRFAFELATNKGCQLDGGKINKLPIGVRIGFHSKAVKAAAALCPPNSAYRYFDDNYLMSDACSLYYKGVNIFPDLFGKDWRKYVPVESHKEIKRQVDKFLEEARHANRKNK